jgi:branched-chain amino acid transport system ATP-binding protein
LASSEKLLEFRSVCVNYGRFRALQNVSYEVRAGQTVCLLGGNASGKSTSMKAIFGTVPLVGGEVYWRGQRIDRWPTARRVQAGLAAVPEGRRVFARMTVQENLTVGACNRSDHAAVAQDMDGVFAMFPRLRERRDQLAGLLSGGEQQMLALGRALMSRPTMICMDEPSMGLSPLLVRQSFALIEQLQARGIAVFVVEQNARAALKVADYGYVLRGGEMVLEGAPEALLHSNLMREAYLGKAR